MSVWKVLYTDRAEEDLNNVYRYIANSLLVPDTAIKQVERIMDAVDSLCEMPMRFPLYEKEPWLGRGLRKLIVDNFIAFYLPVEKSQKLSFFP